MNKKNKNILIFVLTLAGLLVAILYSPIGNSNDYSSLYYYSVNPGVQFSGGIANAPTSSFSTENSDDEVLVPLTNDAGKSTDVRYTVSSTQNEETDYGSAAQLNSGKHDKETQNVGAGGVNLATVSHGSGKNSSKQITGTQTYGFTSISSDLTNNSGNTTEKQSVPHPYGTVTGGTDPGGDPLRPPIPVGDAWIFLLVLSSIYVVVKKLLLK